MSEIEKWELNVDQLVACNCDYGCPCTFQASPTYGTCEGTVAYVVEKGSYKGVKLDGQIWALVAKWPGPLHELNGEGVVFLDESSSDDQKKAITEIATGKAGGPIGIFMSTVSKSIDVKTAKIEVHKDGKNSWFKINDKVNVEFGPILSVTGAEQFPSILIPQGMLTNREDSFSADKYEVDISDNFKFDYPKRNASISNGKWKGP